MNKDIHPIQTGILKELLFKPAARFSEINSNGVPSDQFTFHLKQLIDAGVIEKTADSLYRLTIAGKEFANRFDVDSGAVKLEKQAKLSVVVIATRGNNGALEYLMQTRLKQPFYGFRGFIVGKIKFGESVQEAAQRELFEETGLVGTLEQKTVYHERIFSTTGKLLEDKYFFLFIACNTSGVLQKEFSGGTNDWYPEQACHEGNCFYDIPDLIKLTQQQNLPFSERSYTVETF